MTAQQTPPSAVPPSSVAATPARAGPVADALQRLRRAVDRSEHVASDAAMRALEAAGTADAATLAHARAEWSLSLYRRNLMDEAARAAASALELGRSSGDGLARADGLTAWARVEWAAGQLDEALVHLEQAALPPPPDLRLQTRIQTLLGLVHCDLGRAAASEAFHRAALDAARESGGHDLQLVALTNLAGRLLDSAGPDDLRYAEIDALVAEADALALAHAQEMTLPHILVTQGAALLARGRLDEAQAAFTRWRAVLDAYPDKSSLPHAAAVLARLHCARGDVASARLALAEGIGMALQLGARTRAAALHLQASRLEEELGCFAPALEHHKQFHALREASAVDTAQRRAAMLAVRIETARALHEAAAQRQRATELAARNDQLAEAAYIDPLTGLANRRRLDEQLTLLHAAARAAGTPLVLALLDVDHFKQVNDRCSHAVGDRVLATLARLIAQQVRAGDLCARYGGEEFVIALPALPVDTAAQVLERLRLRVAAEPWSALHPGLKVTVSVGWADITPAPCTGQGLAQADERLYAAKAAGRNRVVGPEPAASVAMAAR